MVKVKGLFLRRNRKYGVRKVSRKVTPSKIRRESRIGYKRLIRANNKVSNLVSIRTLAPFPEAKVCRHKYVERLTIPAGATPNGVIGYIFEPTSLYDPNTTGAGHQPMFRDEMATVYQFYTVVSCVTKVTVSPSSSKSMVFALVTDETPTPESGMHTIMETRKNWVITNPSLRTRPITLRAKHYGPKAFNTTLAGMLADDVHRVTKDGSPGSKGRKYHHFYASNADLGDIPDEDIPIIVEMNYLVIWRDRAVPTGS